MNRFDNGEMDVIDKPLDVRNGNTDTHTATIDWITVDRLSGEVMGLFEQ
jgi:hypothetical protein